MGKRLNEQQKQEIVKQFLQGKPVAELAKELHVSRSSIYAWAKTYQETLFKNAPKQQSCKVLQSKIEYLERIIAILQIAPCTATAPLHDRLNAIEQLSSEYKVHTLCYALNVAKGTYYNHIFRNKRENTVYAKRKAQLKPIIEELYHRHHEILGPGKITAIMKEQGYQVSESTVAKIMHENNWFSVRSCAKTLYQLNRKNRENILKQNFQANEPNQVWLSDVTYFHFNKKTFYICVIIDLFSRKILAHKVAIKNSTQLTKSTFLLAYSDRMPKEGLLFHSDNGGNYIAQAFSECLQAHNVIHSFSQKGNPYDNSVCESFFSNLKQEELYRTNYHSEKELRKSISAYIEFYNMSRPHSALRYMSPNKAEELYFRQHSAKNC